jgi:hypothetical protein
VPMIAIDAQLVEPRGVWQRPTVMKRFVKVAIASCVAAFLTVGCTATTHDTTRAAHGKHARARVTSREHGQPRQRVVQSGEDAARLTRCRLGPVLPPDKLLDDLAPVICAPQY